jgi:hypothetical protein
MAPQRVSSGGQKSGFGENVRYKAAREQAPNYSKPKDQESLHSDMTDEDEDIVMQDDAGETELENWRS